MPRRPPPIAGRYVLLEEIGRGATGSVHRARDLIGKHRCMVDSDRDDAQLDDVAG